MSEFLDLETTRLLPAQIEDRRVKPSRILRGILPRIDFGDPVQKIEAANAHRDAMLAEVDALACRLAEANEFEVIVSPEV